MGSTLSFTIGLVFTKMYSMEDAGGSIAPLIPTTQKSLS
jgi:hypothetical protein